LESNAKNEFLRSIDEFDMSCAPTAEKKRETLLRKKKSGNVSLIRIVVILLCLSVFAYSISALTEIYRSNLVSDSLYNDIYNGFADIINSGITATKSSQPSKSTLLSSSPYTPSKGGSFNTIEQGSTSLKYQQSLSKLEALRSQNDDTVGYIAISGTGINYPIVQRGDNDYYLDHGFDHTSMKSGAIFYDFRCQSSPGDNKNLIVYGHNMANGTMFQQLENFTQNEELFQNGTITIYAFDAIYTYEIFSVYFTNAYTDYLDISFRGQFDFILWAEERAELSIFKKDVKLENSSNVVSLSTCINATSDGRIAVHGVLTNVER